MSHDNQNSQSWFGDVTNSFCAKCELWISSKHVHGLLSSISFCANWNVHSLESLAGNMWKQKNNPTGKLVETVEVLDMTPPVSTLWDVLPLLRRFPKTKKRISWVVISIEYKKTLHIYIYTDISQKIEWHPYSQNTHLSHRLSILSWEFEQWPIAVEILLPPLASQRPTVAQKAANLVISGKWFTTFTSDTYICYFICYPY